MYWFLLLVIVLVLVLWIQRDRESYLAGAADSVLFNTQREKLIRAVRATQAANPNCSLEQNQPWHLDNSCNTKCYKLVSALRTLDAIELAVSGSEQTKAVPFDLVLSSRPLCYPMIPTKLYLSNLVAWVDQVIAKHCRAPQLA